MSRKIVKLKELLNLLFSELIVSSTLNLNLFINCGFIISSKDLKINICSEQDKISFELKQKIK